MRGAVVARGRRRSDTGRFRSATWFPSAWAKHLHYGADIKMGDLQ
jgi:hypothetical protein